MTVTGVANLAVKVRDLDTAVAFYERSGAEVRDRMEWNGGERADVYLGALMITLFTRAIYEDAVDLRLLGRPRGLIARRDEVRLYAVGRQVLAESADGGGDAVDAGKVDVRDEKDAQDLRVCAPQARRLRSRQRDRRGEPGAERRL